MRQKTKPIINQWSMSSMTRTTATIDPRHAGGQPAHWSTSG
jgi:hypothetical protein